MTLRAPVFVTALALAACGDAEGPSTDGALSVTLSGAIEEAFEASGTFPDSGAATASFAAARRGPAFGAFSILGYRLEAGFEDFVQLDLQDVTDVGFYDASGAVRYQGTLYDIVEGEVRITVISPAAVQGRFTALATTAILFPGLPVDTVRLTDGGFGVPIVDATSW